LREHPEYLQQRKIPPQTAAQLRTLIQRDVTWRGTITALAETLDDSDKTASKTAPHLSIWLRQHEPTLWWDYGIQVRFTRTGRQRLVHLQLRESAAHAVMTAQLATGLSPENGARTVS
jgi:hypothetical protein